jgi:hypothetical protein
MRASPSIVPREEDIYLVEVGLGPIDIHSLQIIAAARWMKPVKWEDRLS